MKILAYSAKDMTREEGDEDNDGTCRIITESLYFDGPKLKQLKAAVYILRSGEAVTKAVVRK